MDGTQSRRLLRAQLLACAVAYCFSLHWLNNTFLRFAVLGSTWLVLQSHRKSLPRLRTVALLLPMGVLVTCIINLGVISYTPHPVDPWLSSLDHGLSVNIYSWFARHQPLVRFLNLPYWGLPLAAALFLPHCECPLSVCKRMGFAALLALPCYLLVPAVGPAHVAQLDAPRNCMPSLHLSWALLLFGGVPPRLKFAAGAFVIFTALATLSTGEHYLADLAAAPPFTAFVIWVYGKLERSLPSPTASASLLASDEV